MVVVVDVVAGHFVVVVIDGVKDIVDPIIITEIVIGKSTTDMVVVVAVLLLGVIVPLLVFDIAIDEHNNSRETKHPRYSTVASQLFSVSSLS